ncbi:hypothetical protein BG011_003276 [Mortierella polycephala]|uniref:Uncharacterized protein n=1 Tax=Mortierella polycephala TaxID=41804 RepID=A0A9P6Q5F9_9FUNG|nr:hypothetical protein BG011_003276 [Mortierella polycephala]
MRWDRSIRHEKELGSGLELGHHLVYNDACIYNDILSLSLFRKIRKPMAKIETLNQELNEMQDPKGSRGKGDKTGTSDNGVDDDHHNDSELDRADSVFFREKDPEQDDDDRVETKDERLGEEEDQEEREQEPKIGDHVALDADSNIIEDTTEAMKRLDEKKNNKGEKERRGEKDLDDEEEDGSQVKVDDRENEQDMEDVENKSNDQKSDGTGTKTESTSDDHEGLDAIVTTAAKDRKQNKSTDKEMKGNVGMELESVDKTNPEPAIARIHTPLFSKLRSKLIRQQQEEVAQLLRDIETVGLGSADAFGVVDQSSTSALVTETTDFVPEENMQAVLVAAAAKLAAQEGAEYGLEPGATIGDKTPLTPQKTADTEHQGANAFFELLATDILEASVEESKQSKQSSKKKENNYEAGKKAKKPAKGKEKQKQNGKKAQKGKDKTAIKRDSQYKKKSSKGKHHKRQILIPVPGIAHEHIPLKASIFTPVENGIPVGPFLVRPIKNDAKGDFDRDAEIEKVTADQRKKKKDQGMVNAVAAAFKAIFGGDMRKTVENPSIAGHPKVDGDAAKEMEKKGVVDINSGNAQEVAEGLSVGEASKSHRKQDNRDSEEALDADSGHEDATSVKTKAKAKENKDVHGVNEYVLGTNDKFDDEHQGKNNDGHKMHHKVKSAKMNNTVDEVDRNSPIPQEQPQQLQPQSQPHYHYDKANTPTKEAPIIPIVGDGPVDRKTPDAVDKKDEQATGYGTVPMFGPAQLDLGSGTSAVVLLTCRAMMLLTVAVAALNTL